MAPREQCDFRTDAPTTNKDIMAYVLEKYGVRVFNSNVAYVKKQCDMSFRTYAQYSDVVELVFTPYRKRSRYSQMFYNSSLMIFDGWQDMDEAAINEILKDDGKVKITKSKYSCFSASYIEDLEKVFVNPILVWKNYKKGVNGKLYA